MSDLIDFSKVRIHFGVPAYGGQVTASFMLSWIQLQAQLHRFGLSFTVTCIQNESLVTRARNTIVARFMADPEASHLMFIDADIVFQAEDFVRLLLWNRGIVTACYSAKGINWDQVRENVFNGMEPADLGRRFGHRNFHVEPDAEVVTGTGDPLPQGQIVEIRDATTGFMLIQRPVIERMFIAYPDLAYTTYANTPRHEAPYYYSLFDTSRDPTENTYLSEDFTFCRLWQRLGGKVWLDPHIRLGHVGTLEYRF